MLFRRDEIFYVWPSSADGFFYSADDIHTELWELENASTQTISISHMRIE